MNGRFAEVVAARVFATGASMLSGLVMLRLLPRLLPASEWGVVNVALTVLAYLPLLDGGFRLVVNRGMLQSAEAARRLELGRFGQALATRLLVVALVLGPLLTWLYSWAPAARVAGLRPWFYLVTGWSGALAFAAGMQVQALIGLDRQSRMSLIQGCGSLANLAMLVVGLELGWGVWSFPLAQLAVGVLQWAAASWFLSRLMPGLRPVELRWGEGCRRLWREHRAGAWSVFRMQVFIVLLLSLDLVLAGWIVRDAVELTAYGLVARVIGIGRNTLTSLGDALWPRVAKEEDGDGAGVLTRRVLALNAWLFGIAGGVLGAAVPAVLGWYVSAGWVASPALHLALTARFVVMGVSSPAAYHLLGAGDFRTLMRSVGAEVVLGVVLGGIGGLRWGGAGVAAGFLVSTVAGTFYPLFAAYARGQGSGTPAAWFGQVWARALAGAGVVWGAAWCLGRLGWEGPGTLAVAGLAGLGGLVVAGAWAMWRTAGTGAGWKARVWAGL